MAWYALAWHFPQLVIPEPTAVACSFCEWQELQTLLLVTVAGFFNLSAPPNAAASPLRLEALARYNSAADKRTVADDAQRQVQAWISAP